jgi:hypothetical protein
VKSKRSNVILSIVAHALAWTSFLWLAFWPAFYSGSSDTAIGPDGTGGQVVNTSESLIEVNGWGALIPLAVPVVLTAIGLVAALAYDGRSARYKVIIWIAAVLLIIFSWLAMFSIGMFFMPAALALVVTATIMSLRSKYEIFVDPNI